MGWLKSTNLQFSRCHIFVSFGNNVDIVHYDNNPFWISADTIIPMRMTFNDPIITHQPTFLSLHGSNFVQICAVGSKGRIFSATECVLAVQGRSGSSKVDDFGTNRKRIYDFLLVLRCNYGSYLAPFLRYGDLLAKNCLFFLPLSHSAPSLPMFP